MPTIDVLLPLLSTGVLLLAFFARDGVLEHSKDGAFKARNADFAGLALFALVLAGLYWFNKSSPGYQNGLPATLFGLVAGAFAATLAFWIGRQSWQANAGRTVPIALGALCVCSIEGLGQSASLAGIFGAALASWLLGLKDRSPGPVWAGRATVVTLCVFACDLLGASLEPSVKALGTMFALAAVIAGILGTAIGSFISKKDKRLAFVTPALLFGLLALGGYLICRRNALESGASVTYVAAALLALFVAWVMGEEGAVTTRVVLSAVLWVALATASFGYTKTLGMAMALSAATFMTVLMGKEKALLALGPLGALVIYRLFRIATPGASEAFDIGQHYALIGFLLGVLVPTLALEWRKSAGVISTPKAAGAGALWVLVMAAVPLPIAIALSDKGIVGYLVGLGLAPILEALRGERNAQALSLSIGLSSAMAFLYTWIEPQVDLERAQKIHLLAWILSLMAIAVIGIGVLSAARSKEKV